MTYYAHSDRSPEKDDWQTLKDHSEQVAAIAAQMAEDIGIGKAAALAGLLHDLGKFTAAFQKRLSGAKIRADHSTARARHVLDTVTGKDRCMAELIAYAILGHHAGLPDMRGVESGMTERLAAFKGGTLDPAWQAELAVDSGELMPGFSWEKTSERLAFQLAFLGRMLFSCLVDADFKDTERFYMALECRQADRAWSPLQALLPEFQSRFDSYMAAKQSVASDLNSVRSNILAHVRQGAHQAPGLFTLTVPTGGGKTLASLAFALDHAKAHGHSRIIYAIPFMVESHESYNHTSCRC